MRARRLCLLSLLLVLAPLSVPAPLLAQSAATVAPAGAVVGVGPYLHLVDDLDRSLAFYRALLGTEPGGTPESRDWSRNEPVAVMYGAPGAEIRTATIPVPGSPMPVELVAWRGVPRARIAPRITDPGAAVLILFVRDLAASMGAATSRGGRVVTPGGQPVVRGANRFVLLQDPDGFFVELLQVAQLPAGAVPEGPVALARFRTTALDAARTRRFYAEALGFTLPEPGALTPDATLSAITGASTGGSDTSSRLVTGPIPGTALTFEIAEFASAGRMRVRPSATGIGGSMLRLQVRDIDAVFAAVTAAGARSVTPRPVILKDNRRMVIVEDPDGLLVQFWQVAP